jgi:hypothetical protein
MRVTRVRFTVRRMMVAVAVMAVVLSAADQLRRRRESFVQRAEESKRRVSAAYRDEQSARVGNPFDFDPRTTTAYSQWAEHHSAMREKYERAAASPWLFVGPDPPEPDWPNGVPRR